MCDFGVPDQTSAGDGGQSLPLGWDGCSGKTWQRKRDEILAVIRIRRRGELAAELPVAMGQEPRANYENDRAKDEDFIAHYQGGQNN